MKQTNYWLDEESSSDDLDLDEIETIIE